MSISIKFHLTRYWLMVIALACAGVVCGQEAKPSDSAGTREPKSVSSMPLVRPGAPAATGDLTGTRGSVLVETSGGYTTLDGGVILKPVSSYPWMLGMVGSASGGFAIINNAGYQLLKVQNNGDFQVFGPTSTSGLLVRDSDVAGMGPGGVQVSISGNSALVSGAVQVGAFGTGMINSLGPQPLALNAWSPQDVTVGWPGETGHGLRVYSAGPSWIAGRVGIGLPYPYPQPAPEAKLQIYSTDTTSTRDLLVDHRSSDALSALFMGRKARLSGSNGPAAVVAGDSVMSMTPAAFDGTAYVSSARVSFAVDGAVSTGNVPTAIKFMTGTTSENERMRITAGGTVAIGAAAVAAPNTSYTLHVSGNSNFAGNANFTGTITGGNIQALYQDVAEWVPSAEDLSPGTVVILDPAAGNGVMKSNHAYDTTVAGVVSAQPGIVLGRGGASQEQIATTGRVRVKVDAAVGPIRVGDLLVTSDKPGLAMKSEPIDVNGTRIHRPGTIVGKALQNLPAGEGEILVLLSLQ